MSRDIFFLAAEKLKENQKKAGTEFISRNENEPPHPDDEKLKEDSYLLVFGSKDCGKTSLLYRFLDRDEQPKPTIALEYTYGRRNRGNAKDVGHLWELGGGPFLLNLTHIPLSATTLEDTALVLMVDLSKPEELWNTTMTLLDGTRTRVNKLLSEFKYSDSNLYNALKAKAWNRVGSDHLDKEMLNPFPVPLAIVGGKYDIFQDFDSEKKKAICKTLRFIAHINGASLQFFSTRIESLVTRGRALLSHLVFETQGSKGMSVDYNKPLFIPAGADSFKEIGAPTSEGGGSMLEMASNPTELWKTAFASQFPQKDLKMEVKEDPGKDPQYKEEIIDILRAQKDQELERYIAQKEREEAQEKKLEKPIQSSPPKRRPQTPPDSPPETPAHHTPYRKDPSPTRQASTKSNESGHRKSGEVRGPPPPQHTQPPTPPPHSDAEEEDPSEDEEEEEWDDSGQ